ncbi:DUF6495 family protein [Patiriisocius hiemis]|uniref:DUF6495 family protein n=1 Tax=Patiriisocius hiemis TaxID=3075604 RepID=A0ABU2Y8H8_9FLAO|nr:DUF6495 family protein [Constantimarinum sp. W242]MDT0554483.1 DUF6495 family protein [Constantimarinum sp. W242]
MKYARLTKEQFEELHQEFINFLATQSITAQEWENIKTKQPEVAEEELDVFSDLVWEGVLKKAKYLENIAPQQMFLFKLEDVNMSLIGIKVLDPTKNINTKEGYRWLQQNYMTDNVEFVTGTKKYSNDPQKDIFNLIQQGASITKGELYIFFDKLINS